MRLRYPVPSAMGYPRSVFGTLTSHARSADWPTGIMAALDREHPVDGIDLVAIRNPDGTAMARIRGAWLIYHEWAKDTSNRRMPELVLPAAKALVKLFSTQVTADQIVAMYGAEGRTSKPGDLLALLDRARLLDPYALS